MTKRLEIEKGNIKTETVESADRRAREKTSNCEYSN